MKRAPFLCLFLAACGDPVSVGGQYTVALTNKQNGCAFQNWREGDTTQNVPLQLTQSGADVTGVVGGIPGGYLTLVLGSNTFTGKVVGANIDMMLYGRTTSQQGSCSYTVNARATATLAADFLAGSIDYTAATNGAPDCGALKDCKSQQAFNGTRPPAR